MRRVSATPPCHIAGDIAMVLPGEMYHSEYEVATETGKKITRGILKAVWKNGKRGKCFSDFSSSNIFISVEGKVKFKAVKHLVKPKIEHGVQLRQNYLQARLIIHDMFSSAAKYKIPEDIDNLLKMILEQPGKSELYHIHASLVPQGTRWYMYAKMYDHLTHSIPEPTREDILPRLPYLAVWKTKLQLNALLMAVYNFKVGSYDVTEEKAKAKYIKKTGQNWSALSSEQKKRKVEVMRAQKFADFLRHRIAHRMDNAQAHGHYTAEGSDMVTQVRFSMVMAYLQEELFDAVVIHELRLEQFF